MQDYQKKINSVFIVPTGLGAEIGGHAGDATPALKLIASVSDIVITHPNVVNASDINEITENTLYVEGSTLDRFLWGNIELEPVFSNRILLAVNGPVDINITNAVSAARATIGADMSILELNTSLEMVSRMENGCAAGEVFGWRQLVRQVNDYEFDALAIATPITVDDEVALKYLKNGGVNPWGGVEAIASKLIAGALDKPVAHCPVGQGVLEKFIEVVDPRMAAETVSVCYLHCALKGLHRAPRIGRGLSVRDVSCLITPIGCIGEPHWACSKAGIPVIAVKENKTCLNENPLDGFILVENYLEAAGTIAAMRAGVTPESVRRPLCPTEIIVNQ